MRMTTCIKPIRCCLPHRASAPTWAKCVSSLAQECRARHAQCVLQYATQPVPARTTVPTHTDWPRRRVRGPGATAPKSASHAIERVYAARCSLVILVHPLPTSIITTESRNSGTWRLQQSGTGRAIWRRCRRSVVSTIYRVLTSSKKPGMLMCCRAIQFLMHDQTLMTSGFEILL